MKEKGGRVGGSYLYIYNVGTQVGKMEQEGGRGKTVRDLQFTCHCIGYWYSRAYTTKLSDKIKSTSCYKENRKAELPFLNMYMYTVLSVPSKHPSPCKTLPNWCMMIRVSAQSHFMAGDSKRPWALTQDTTCSTYTCKSIHKCKEMSSMPRNK